MKFSQKESAVPSAWTRASPYRQMQFRPLYPPQGSHSHQELTVSFSAEERALKSCLTQKTLVVQPVLLFRACWKCSSHVGKYIESEDFALKIYIFYKKRVALLPPTLAFVTQTTYVWKICSCWGFCSRRALRSNTHHYLVVKSDKSNWTNVQHTNYYFLILYFTPYLHCIYRTTSWQ